MYYAPFSGWCTFLDGGSVIRHFAVVPLESGPGACSIYRPPDNADCPTWWLCTQISVAAATIIEPQAFAIRDPTQRGGFDTSTCLLCGWVAEKMCHLLIFATCMTSCVPWQMVRIIRTLISQSLLTADFLSGTGKEMSIVCFLVDCAERSAEECCELARFIFEQEDWARWD